MRIPALDITRFIAALLVVLYHFIPVPPSDTFPILSNVAKFGYLGVPLFFIISGYVIALSADNRSPIEFAISRFVRLYPALWVGVIFTVSTTYLLINSNYSIWHVLSNFTLINEYLGFPDIDGVYWTLKVELKFYACVFILLMLGIFQRYQIWLSIWLAMTICHTFISQPFFMGWFISPAYSSFFISGIAYFLIQKKGKTRFNLGILFASLPISCINAHEQASHFISNASPQDQLWVVAIICAMYVFFYFLALGKVKAPDNKAVITLGALTYPLYLIHNAAGKAFIERLQPHMGQELAIYLTTAIMIVSAFCIYRFVEKPLATPMKHYLLGIFSRTDKRRP